MTDIDAALGAVERAVEYGIEYRHPEFKEEARAGLATIKALLASHADNIEYGQKAAADAYRYHTWFLMVRDERDNLKAQLERQEECSHGFPVPYSLAHGSQEIGWEEVCAGHESTSPNQEKPSEHEWGNGLDLGPERCPEQDCIMGAWPHADDAHVFGEAPDPKA